MDISKQIYAALFNRFQALCGSFHLGGWSVFHAMPAPIPGTGQISKCTYMENIM